MATAAGCILVLSPVALLSRPGRVCLCGGDFQKGVCWFFGGRSVFGPPLFFGKTHSLPYTGAALAVTVLVWAKHGANIKRLAAGKEPRFF